eukprot:4307928-Amphidinium_carterae.1
MEMHMYMFICWGVNPVVPPKRPQTRPLPANMRPLTQPLPTEVRLRVYGQLGPLPTQMRP